ncbi:hypothetical protein CDL27_13260 [Mediterraneibacter gnavus]|uniref:Uncharacterized protein n=1 Tax=Roseburia intestinalis TaxID=166486 RepID=A0A3R6KG82_9FIRM|nr:hypothetical protein CDL27_13260 [Mediterraneibacter gnavus]RHG28226.1 hypothetical protein DW264_09855 [Roseburia intestinalis]
MNSVTDIPKVYTRNSTIGEILADTNGKEIFQKTMAQMLGDNAQLIAAQEDNSGAINEEMMTAMAEGMSLRQLLSFIPGVSRNVLEELINKLNKHKFKMEEAQQYWIMRSLLSPPFFPLYSKSSSSFRYSLYIKKQLD